MTPGKRRSLNWIKHVLTGFITMVFVAGLGALPYMRYNSDRIANDAFWLMGLAMVAAIGIAAFILSAMKEAQAIRRMEEALSVPRRPGDAIYTGMNSRSAYTDARELQSLLDTTMSTVSGTSNRYFRFRYPLVSWTIDFFAWINPFKSTTYGDAKNLDHVEILTPEANAHLREVLEQGSSGDPAAAAVAAVRLLGWCVSTTGSNEERIEAEWQARRLYTGSHAYGLMPDLVMSILADTKREGSPDTYCKRVQQGMDFMRRRMLLEACCAVMIADGEIDSLQRELLISIATKIGYARIDASILIRDAETAWNQHKRKVDARRRKERQRFGARSSDQSTGSTGGSNASAWAALNIPRTATLKEARRTWHLLAMKFHPDRYAQASSGEQIHAEAHFKELARAWQLVEEELIAREAAATGR